MEDRWPLVEELAVALGNHTGTSCRWRRRRKDTSHKILRPKAFPHTAGRSRPRESAGAYPNCGPRLLLHLSGTGYPPSSASSAGVLTA
jgi:hypothetical protein